jgi:hypothetical protein
MTSLAVYAYAQRVSLGEVDAGQRHRGGSLTCADTPVIRTAGVQRTSIRSQAIRS